MLSLCYQEMVGNESHENEVLEESTKDKEQFISVPEPRVAFCFYSF